MEQQEVLRILVEVGAVITDSHIVYTSGKHGMAYMNKDAVYPHTVDTSLLCHAIAEGFLDDDVEVVVAPAIGGVILSQWVANHLTHMKSREVLGVYAEKVPITMRVFAEGEAVVIPISERFVFKRGYDKFIHGKKVLVVEDVLTTGGSVKKVIEAVRELEGKVIGLGVLCNRGGITPQDVANVPKLLALVDVKFDAWDAADCPLCKENVPVNTDVGKGREFLAHKEKK